MDVAGTGITPGEAWVWLSATTTVSTTGAELAVAVINPAGSSIDYGVLGSFERWNSKGWTRVGSWVTSLDHWGGFPTVAPEGQRVAIPAIGLSAPAHVVGAVEYFSLPPLSEGVYRVSHSAAAFGIIRVTADTPRPVPIDNPHPQPCWPSPHSCNTARKSVLQSLLPVRACNTEKMCSDSIGSSLHR